MKSSAAGGRRVASGFPSAFRPSTQQRNGIYRFPRRARLTKKAEMDRVRKEGRRLRSDSIDVRTLASPLTYPRVGIIVPRFRHTVVERNKVRRRLRELVRTTLLPTLQPQDVLLRAGPEAYTKSYGALQHEIERIAIRLAGATR